MARSRNIKPGFFSNEDLAECTPWARLCFAGLWTLADREGRLEDRPKRIKGELFRYDSIEVEPLLRELERYGFIVRYEVDGGRFIQVSKFGEHQTPHYSEKPSVIKPPPLQEFEDHIDDEDSERTPGVEPPSRGVRNPLIPDSLIPDSPPTPRKRESGGGGRFDEFWSAWPKSERKQDRKKCVEHWRRHSLDRVADAILADIAVKARTDKWRGGYVEAPLVYLNGRRWEDGVEPTGPAPVSAPASESVEAYQARIAAERKAERERLAQQAGPTGDVKAKLAELRGLRVAQ